MSVEEPLRYNGRFRFRADGMTLSAGGKFFQHLRDESRAVLY